MTLVLTLITRDVVVQVSDRRLVRLESDGSIGVADENANKAVFFAHRAVYGYTGIAAVGPYRQSTDEWLADAIASAPDQGQAMDALARAATERWKHRLIRSYPPELRRHEFAGAGWAKFHDGDGQFESYVSVVSNFRGPDRKPIPLSDNFLRIVFRLEPEHDALLIDCGYELSQEDRARVFTRLSHVAQSEASAWKFATVVVDAIREIADRSDVETVGKGVLVTCIPKKIVETPRDFNIVLATAPMEDEATFLYIDEDVDTAIQYGPIVVTQSGSIMANFEARPLTPDESHRWLPTP